MYFCEMIIERTISNCNPILIASTDHLGSSNYITDTSGEVYQHNEYFPYGETFVEERNGAEYTNYLFSGKELDAETGLYYFGARYHDPRTSVFFGADPMVDKYPGISPYAYCGNNPIRFIDPDGREVRVAEEYRQQFTNDLRNVFGDKTDQFSFNENGTLQLEGKAKDFTNGMSKDQKAAFNGLNKAMSDKQVTSVVYENTQNLTIDGQTKSVDIVAEFGGGLYSKTDNMIVVAPNVGSVEVNLTLEGWQATGKPTQNVKQNTTSTLFHEIGERNTKNENYRGGVIDFENYARRVIGLPVRPYDLYHKK